MGRRYTEMFRKGEKGKRGAFVPFVVAGDPRPEISREILMTLAAAGADALEIGLPFSDPIADGPVIQRANRRALDAGGRPSGAWDLVRGVRARYADLPIGLLVYANLIEAVGLDGFYRKAAEAGVDSVLVADVPCLEAGPYVAAALRWGVDPVLIATANSGHEHLRRIAALGQGYTYVVTRAGVTGVDETAQTDQRGLIEELDQAGSPPSLLGFGIAKPEHVRNAIEAGARGAISGSAVVLHIEQHPEGGVALAKELTAFVHRMKQAAIL